MWLRVDSTFARDNIEMWFKCANNFHTGVKSENDVHVLIVWVMGWYVIILIIPHTSRKGLWFGRLFWPAKHGEVVNLASNTKWSWNINLTYNLGLAMFETVCFATSFWHHSDSFTHCAFRRRRPSWPATGLKVRQQRDLGKLFSTSWWLHLIGTPNRNNKTMENMGNNRFYSKSDPRFWGFCTKHQILRILKVLH